MLLYIYLQAKEDEQQRNWMLYEDEAAILRNLEKLSLTLKNANEDIRCGNIGKYPLPFFSRGGGQYSFY
jgi:hypothetical protein